MGNTVDTSQDSSSAALPNRSRRMLSREQLRAKSFLEKEQHAVQGATAADADTPGGEAESYDLMESASDQEHQLQQLMIEKLELDIQRLSEKCSALESQNILVSVQQLDLFTRGFSYVLSFSVLFLYWKVIVWTMTNLNVNLNVVYERVLSMEFRTGIQDILQPYADHFVIQGGRMLVHHDWFPRVAQAVLLLLPYLYNRWTHGSTHRRFEVFVVFFVVLVRVKMCRWRERLFLQEDSSTIGKYGEGCTNDGIWEANYEISARFLYLSILRLRGLWTKTAQYLSSRADFMPVGYIRELSKLQDQAPATEWDEVQKLLPASLLRGLTDIDPTPLASASIGQVHTARLKATGEKVVIKVQHPHARTLMTDDFWSLKVLTRIIGWLEPEYAFIEILMNEWATEARKELDFTFEAQNLREARDALTTMFPDNDNGTSVVYTNTNSNGDDDDGDERVPFQVEVPEPIEELSNRNVLVMSFSEGCRVDDFAEIENLGLSRNAIMDGISQTFAHFMYCSTIFNGDPHPGNLLVRPGTQADKTKGFTVVVLDWGLVKRLPERKRVAFCQMVYAAATMDYGLLLDSYETVGLRMKREDTGQGMEDMRFFLRDMAPRDVARKRIKSKMKQDKEQRKISKEKVPMESKAYPGEFFFFVRVNELLQGLGSRFNVNLGYLDTLRPYAEKGLRQSNFYDVNVPPVELVPIHDRPLQKKLQTVLKELEDEKELVGGQVCILNKSGELQADVVAGSLGGLRSHIPMQRNALILGYSTTKAVTATLAHIMVDKGFLSYDEPVCERVWNAFCPTEDPPKGLSKDLGLPFDEVVARWHWKRQITLRHILSHSAGLSSAFPAKLTVQTMASCEKCFAAYEYNPNAPEETVLPTRIPGEKSEYHFMSFGWLVAGTLCGAYASKHEKTRVSFEEVYKDLLEPKLSEETRSAGFRPLGGSGGLIMAQTVTSDIRASKIMQQKREADVLAEQEEKSDSNPGTASEMFKTFKGKEFLLDPRVWNCQHALDANVPAAGGRFSAVALAHFYHDLATAKLLPTRVLNEVTLDNCMETSVSALQGVTRIANDSDNNQTKMGLGYQLIRTERDGVDQFSGVGHAGVGGSIGFLHKPTGLSIGVMLNKADGGQEVTLRILRVIGDHYSI